MKTIIILLFTLVMAACTSSGSKETDSPDSTSVSDTISAEPLPEVVPTLESNVDVTGDTSQLTARFDEISEATTNASENYYTVTITTSQYEASSDVTWYFDDSFSPRYFKMSWAAEGNEGSTEYFIENNKVVCAQEEGNNETKKWCLATGGTRITWREDTDDNKPALLTADFGATCNESLDRYSSILAAILKEGETTDEDENSYTIRIEKTADIGMEVKESTEVKIPKKVYKSIMGE